MSIGWDSLPLLPLKCVLEHLSVKDALAATSTCRHWRSVIMIYEGHKDTLKLRTKQLEKNLLLTRLFRKNTRKLHIYISGSREELEKFMNFILPQFFDAVKLQEIFFIGPGYLQQTRHSTQVQLKRIITESLVFKHLNSLQRLALFGCEIDTAKSDDERYTHKHLEYYARPLTFSTEASPGDTVLSRCNTRLMVFSTLQHIITEYEFVNTDCLETLSHLTLFTQLTLNVTNSTDPLFPIDWRRLRPCYPNKLHVAINIISLSQRKLDEVIPIFLDEDLRLVSLKVMFCKVLYYPLLIQMLSVHKSSLTELVWVDCPYESTDPTQRYIIPPAINLNECCVNPFILLCWQCVNLKRLVIHGYWVWKYDLLGMVRLRRSLEHLEVSSICGRLGRFPGAPNTSQECALRVMMGDANRPMDNSYIREINECLDYKWQPIPWSSLHRGLQARAAPQHRAEYILHEARQALITSFAH